MRALLLTTCTCLLAAVACISSLPDDPVELPDGPVEGLTAVYLTEAEARAVAFADAVPEYTPWAFRTPPLAVDTLLVVLDTGRGLFVGRLDTLGQFAPGSYLSAPGASRLDTNGVGELVFDNHGDRVTGRLSGPRSFDISFRTPDAFPPGAHLPSAHRPRARARDTRSPEQPRPPDLLRVLRPGPRAHRRVGGGHAHRGALPHQPTHVVNAVATLLAAGVALVGFRQNAAAQDLWSSAPEPTGYHSRRHQVSVFAPDQTFLNTPDRVGIGTARVTSASAHYKFFLVEDLLYVGGLVGAATTHPRLRDVAGRWSGIEFGLTAGIGRYLNDALWVGTQVRATLVRAPFRLDGYVPSEDGQFFAPALDVPSSLRQDNLEGAALLRIFFGDTGLFLGLEAGLSIYRRGVFSDADLYPGFTRDEGFLFPDVVRLPQNEYNASMALRARAGLGFAW